MVSEFRHENCPVNSPSKSARGAPQGGHCPPRAGVESPCWVSSPRAAGRWPWFVCPSPARVSVSVSGSVRASGGAPSLRLPALAARSPWLWGFFSRSVGGGLVGASARSAPPFFCLLGARHPCRASPPGRCALAGGALRAPSHSSEEYMVRRLAFARCVSFRPRAASLRSPGGPRPAHPARAFPPPPSASGPPRPTPKLRKKTAGSARLGPFNTPVNNLWITRWKTC